ncbi:alpha/beta fold hydrolase [Kurthia sibirica]|uniref:Alpha/beta hydrolase n=1 Tax=Kurthia sibirica TaxID=202750 RepID=A0A2U3AMF5_9BACL|nr:alpha/beta hydrolase [Kurthia sibirica]PWI25704.1 alpha/beta hydrolase [Kurthia sibirica]GEK33709.1 sigma factor SigB regulation protein RsbQ [Kurthia sibirica]
MVNIIERNNVQMIGDGQQTILCAHGFGCEQSMWKYITPNFQDDYRIVLFDYVGAGKSDISAYDSSKYNSLHGYKEDVIDVIEALDLENIIFFGHSISSMVGMLAAIEHPEYFQKLIMIGPSPCYINEKDGYQGGFEKSDVYDLLEMMEMNFSGWASYMAPVGMGDAKPQLTAELEDTFVSTNPRIAREFAEVTFFSDYRNLVNKLTTPTLILQCSEDSIVPIHVGQYLHDRMQNSELVVLDARGHYPHISHPVETTTIIQNYLVR